MSCTSGTKSMLVKARRRRNEAEEESRMRSQWVLDPALRSMDIFLLAELKVDYGGCLLV